jgi:YD repeat-containing protein
MKKLHSNLRGDCQTRISAPPAPSAWRIVHGLLCLLLGLTVMLAQPLVAGTVVYTHDAAGRLIGAGFSGDKFIGYTYDRAGNLTLRQLTVVASGDTDGDGMDDAWEFAYFQTLGRDGTGDFDGDGVSDLAEFLAGTLPNDPTSVLKILPNPTVTGGGVTIQWQSVPGKTYRVQFKNSLNDADWTNVPGDIPASGASASKTDATVLGQLTRFYRVVLIP